jgi:hypothetical protein
LYLLYKLLLLYCQLNTWTSSKVYCPIWHNDSWVSTKVSLSCMTQLFIGMLY